MPNDGLLLIPGGTSALNHQPGVAALRRTTKAQSGDAAPTDHFPQLPLIESRSMSMDTIDYRSPIHIVRATPTVADSGLILGPTIYSE